MLATSRDVDTPMRLFFDKSMHPCQFPVSFDPNPVRAQIEKTSWMRVGGSSTSIWIPVRAQIEKPSRMRVGGAALARTSLHTRCSMAWLLISRRVTRKLMAFVFVCMRWIEALTVRAHASPLSRACAPGAVSGAESVCQGRRQGRVFARDGVRGDTLTRNPR